MDYPAGDVTFKIDDPLNLGHLDYPMELTPGETYYVALAVKFYGFSGGALGYLLSNHDVAPKAVCESDWCAITLSEADAAPVLQKMGYNLPTHSLQK